MPHTLQNVLPVTATVNSKGVLEIGGSATTDLAERFGTPLIIFCEESFRAKAREFRKAFPDATVYYAAKAFMSLAIAKLAEEEGLGIDVASAGELHAALTAGFPPERIVHHGNNKSDSEIDRSIEARVGLIAIDSIEEVVRVGNAAAKSGRTQRVLVRVTPGVIAHTHEYVETGREDSKFGVSVDSGAASEALELAQSVDSLELVGIHSHIGSNIFSFDPYAKTIEILFEFLAGMTKQGVELEQVSLGGGIGIPYVAGDYPARLDLLADLVRETAEREANRLGITLPQLSFEPGRFLAGNSAITLYTVGTIKHIPGVRTYVSVDGGMSDNIRPALYGSAYAAVVANKAKEETEMVATVAGLHCESGDILIKDAAFPSSLERGDLIAVPATGAYGYSMASNYNMQPRPAVIAVSEGKAQTIIRRESLDDLIRLHEPLA